MLPKMSKGRNVKLREEEQTVASIRRATVYDAVAGRVGYEGFIINQRPSKFRDTKHTSLAAVAPDEVLFRREGAPTRYAESDVYFADRQLAPNKKLPDSDLLKAIHAYTSDFYSAAVSDGGEKYWQSLDETALLAIGILLEEAATEAVGRTGDLAVVESEDVDEDVPESTLAPLNTATTLAIGSSATESGPPICKIQTIVSPSRAESL